MSCIFFCSSRRRHTRCALVTGVQTCALPILIGAQLRRNRPDRVADRGIRFEEVGIEAARAAGIVIIKHPDIDAETVRQRLGIATVEIDLGATLAELGRASCRERVCQYVSISVVAESLNKKNITHSTTFYLHTKH